MLYLQNVKFGVGFRLTSEDINERIVIVDEEITCDSILNTDIQMAAIFNRMELLVTQKTRSYGGICKSINLM